MALEAFKKQLEKQYNKLAIVYGYKDTEELISSGREEIELFQMPCCIVYKNTVATSQDNVATGSILVKIICDDKYKVPINSKIVIDNATYISSSIPAIYDGTHQEIMLSRLENA